MKLSIIGAGNMGGAIARGLSSIRQDISTRSTMSA